MKSSKTILVTGGAGYIGSFIIRELKNQNYSPFVVDNFDSGHVSVLKGIPYAKIDIVTEGEKLNKLFSEQKFDGCIHMASLIQMGESFRNPGKYFNRNINAAVNLFEAMVKNKVNNVIFSSSAGVYGTPERTPIKEDDTKKPENPYGETKLMIEKILSWYDKAYSLKSICIRYFNAAGGALDGSLGEDHPNESHIIPLMIKSAIEEKEFTLFGNDYKTKDKTCVRDYIHVLDLARAHVLAINALFDGTTSDCFNAGVGRGYSNLEILKEIEKVAGKVNWKFGPRRPGDADTLYADVEKIKNKLKFVPEYGLKEIVESAYLWHSKNPKGYQD
jgi:UDP-glucose 4-epimerase